MTKFFATVFAVLTLASTVHADDNDGMVCKKITTFETVDGNQVVRIKTICEVAR